MVAEIIDGKELAKKIRAGLAQRIKNLKKEPALAVVLVGDNEASKIYVRNKQKAAAEVGIKCEVFELPAKTKEKDLVELIEALNKDEKVDGILIQLPLPQHIDSSKIISMINPLKDVDGFSPWNAGLLQTNSKEAVIAATPKGILCMLETVCDNLAGKHVVIIGRSNIVGRPVASLLLNHDCTVTITHSKTKGIERITKEADILIAACGCPKIVKKDWVKKGAIIIDVGINRVADKLCGDVDFEDVSKVASYVSPVPGGVGPMTIAMLLDNVYEICLSKS